MAVNPIGKLSARLVVPPMVCATFLAIYLASHILHRVVPTRVQPFNTAHTINCTGVVLQILFISICMGVIVPFKCTEHPVGNISTLVDMPHEVCGVGDHVPMSVLGAVFLFLYPIGAVAACTYVIYILPQRTANDPTFLNYFKFLVGRFRFDRFYFGILFMLRNMSIAAAPMVNPNNPLLQQVVMCSLLLVALCTQAVLWPWAANEMNWLDLTCLVAMITTVVLTAGMVDATTVDTGTMAVMAAIAVSIAFGLMFVAVAHAVLKMLVEVCKRRQLCTALTKRFGGSSAAARISDTVQLLNVVTHSFSSWTENSMERFVVQLPTYDLVLLEQALTMLVGASATDMSLNSRSCNQSSWGTRITVQRFKPDQAVKKASLMTLERAQETDRLSVDV